MGSDMGMKGSKQRGEALPDRCTMGNRAIVSGHLLGQHLEAVKSSRAESDLFHTACLLPGATGSRSYVKQQS
jgi:hypothetical protein